MNITTTSEGEKEKTTTSSPTSLPRENGRPKSTPNLGNIFKTTPKKEAVETDKIAATPSKPNEPITESNVREAWSVYSEKRKNQVAEYHLLTQEFTLTENEITLHLTNPIEEPLLQSIKSDLLSFLRERINNSTLQLKGVLHIEGVKKKAYTNKEKFEYLMEKNPHLQQLKEKLGLDPDF